MHLKELCTMSAFMGSINTENSIEKLEVVAMENYSEMYIEPLLFDMYITLTAGISGIGTGGMRVMGDKHYYGCCACIGAACNGLTSKMTVMSSKRLICA